jgi:hypothetical protein
MKRPVKRGRISRLYYVGSKRTGVLHLAPAITEGYRTLCGVVIPPPGRWYWAHSRSAQSFAKKAPLCRKCKAKAP